MAAEIGEEQTLILYRGFVMQMLSTIKRGDFPFYIYFYPENALKGLREWLGPDYQYLPQKGEDLGQRMKHGFLQAFEMGFKEVLLIGSDIPDLPLEFIEEAFSSLEDKDVVIGPAYDGGYYLIGFKDKTFSPQVFEGMSWGSEAVFDETMRVLKQFNQKIHTLPYLRDIDTIEDLNYN